MLLVKRAEVSDWHNGGAQVGLLVYLSFVCLSFFVAVTGCEKPTAESIETWKGTVKGPQKLEAALVDNGLDPALRAQAALALRDIGKGDRVAANLAELPAAARAPLVSALLAALSREIDNPMAAQAASARDGLFELRQYASDSERAEIDTQLLAAIRKQLLAGAKLGGSQSLAKVVEAIGAKAASVLVELIQNPAVNHLELANLLDKVADDRQREEASANLAKLVRGRRNVDMALWQALGVLGGASARAALMQAVRGENLEHAVYAGQALALRPDDDKLEVLSFALAIAADPKMHGNVREAMFGVAELCCGARAVAGLARLVSTSKEELVRYRAYAAAVAAGGAGAIVPTLDAFPAGLAYKVEDVRDFLVRDIEKLAGRRDGRAEVIDALLAGLGSSSVLTRMVAVLALEKVGRAEDASALERLAGDRARLRGAKLGTIGDEAKRVATKLSLGG